MKRRLIQPSRLVKEDLSKTEAHHIIRAVKAHIISNRMRNTAYLCFALLAALIYVAVEVFIK